MCMHVCVYVCMYAPRTVSMDKILHFLNTFIIIIVNLMIKTRKQL